MKFNRLFLFLFFIFTVPCHFSPSVNQLQASNHGEKEGFTKYITKAEKNLKQANAVISSFSSLSTREERVKVLEEAINYYALASKYYQKAIDHKKAQGDTINHCRAGINFCRKQMAYLLSINPYLPLIDTLFHKTYEANVLRTELPFPDINDMLKMIGSLEAAAKIYEESIELCKVALVEVGPSLMDPDNTFIKDMIKSFKEKIRECQQKTSDWQKKILKEKEAVVNYLQSLEKRIHSLEPNGSVNYILELYRQLKELLEASKDYTLEYVDHLKVVETTLLRYEEQIKDFYVNDSNRKDVEEEFWKNEELRRENFYRDLPLNSPKRDEDYLDCFRSKGSSKASYPIIIPLTGQQSRQQKTPQEALLLSGREYFLYQWQTDQFLVQDRLAHSSFSVKVYQQDELVYEELISIPKEGSDEWSYYVLTGMAIIPNTKLRSEYGLSLRLMLCPNPNQKFSLLIHQKGCLSQYRYAMSFGDIPLYQCTYKDFLPWQLNHLVTPQLHVTEKPIDHFLIKAPLFIPPFQIDLKPSHRELKEFVEQLSSDPIAIAGYVYNEIELVDPFLTQINGVFFPPRINRSPYGTFLEKRGSQWEQCELLVELLRIAGYPASFVQATCLIPHSFAEKLLFKQIEGKSPVVAFYPYVIVQDGEEFISLFPWMKEMQITEGKELYSLLPDEYATADKWILKYLTNDEAITKHIQANGNDTAGVLFTAFVKEELSKQGLSLADVGIHRHIQKREHTSWNDFLSPELQDQGVNIQEMNIIQDLSAYPTLFAQIKIEISSQEHPEKKMNIPSLPLADCHCSTFPIHFSPSGEEGHIMHFGLKEKEFSLPLDQTDKNLTIKVFCTNNNICETLTIAKGTAAALCIHLGGETRKLTSIFAKKFKESHGELEKTHALLSFIGMDYFEKCSRAEKELARLHKIDPGVYFFCGLAKLSPDLSSGPLKGAPILAFPQVDMHHYWVGHEEAFSWHQENHLNRKQYSTLINVDFSSNEHEVLREVFQDPYAISTVKLLQIAHLEHKKKGLPGIGFLVFSQQSFLLAESSPELARGLYFSHLPDLNLKKVKAYAGSQWKITCDRLKCDKKKMSMPNQEANFSRVYMTPGPISSLDGNELMLPSYCGMGTLLHCPLRQAALISDQSRIMNGGFGSKLPPNYINIMTREEFEIMMWENYPVLAPTTTAADRERNLGKMSPYPSYLPHSPDWTLDWTPDVRLSYKQDNDSFADPVDIVSGAFYIDEIDLSLSGPFPLEIRRNYNSQNPIYSSLGFGWKLSLNPDLMENGELLLAAEEDGTIIAYRFNAEKERWEVTSEDNPDLRNHNKRGIGGIFNPFHAYIESHENQHTLYGPDGSKRVFFNYQLQKWTNHAGHTLTFSYKNLQLARIESSNGGYLGFCYNHTGQLVEAYAKDGRRVYYTYDVEGNLSRVTLPNDAVIAYDYDSAHQIIRETKPHGHVLENQYENGKVIEQRSPVGPRQQMQMSASFCYLDGLTIAKDAAESPVKYYIFQKQIYKTVDPEGNKTLQSWFIDSDSWFDAKTASIQPWEGAGSWKRSLKETIDKRGLSTCYQYDSSGNPVTISLLGEDLTGVGDREVTKQLTYNERNLCTSEKTLEKTKTITYDTNFPQLPKQIEELSNGHVVAFAKFSYTSSGLTATENKSGAITHWTYDERGFPKQKSQETGTDDPAVITEYTYNDQGQCTEVKTAEATIKTNYDIMGNAYRTCVYAPSGKLLDANYSEYNLNNQLIWNQGIDPLNCCYFDYTPFGTTKAIRKCLSQMSQDKPEYAGAAYTLYESDPRGLPLEEIDPCGHSTFRQYDLLGRVIQTTKQGLSHFVTYEPGGLVSTSTHPGGGKTSYSYTTNGLLKKERYPDGTERSLTYDFYGRLREEINQFIDLKITYDDVLHQETRTYIGTGIQEIQFFDLRGNVIEQIDGEGHSWKKEYDLLNRIISETSPEGRKTTYHYIDDRVISYFSNGEKQIERFAAGEMIENSLFSKEGALLRYTAINKDPKESRQEEITREGSNRETSVVTHYNTLGQVISLKKDSLLTKYSYDACGNCRSVLDGEGRLTTTEFDSLGRSLKKTLPDGTSITYAYDADSNLINSCLPGGIIWSASYDQMGRKSTEEVQSGVTSTQQKQYDYEHGQLSAIKDSLNRLHTYTYDSLGRLTAEVVDDHVREFAYDKCGRLIEAKQESHNDRTIVTRKYDPSGRLIEEIITLNSKVLQHTYQSWTGSERTLEIEDHTRNFQYEGGKLKSLLVNNLEFHYAYGLRGELESKKTPFVKANYSYHPCLLPKGIQTSSLGGNHVESLAFDQSGKLSTYQSNFPECGGKNTYAYNKRGFLKTLNDQAYEFDFGNTGRGVRTSTADSKTHALDPFGNVIEESFQNTKAFTAYDNAGQVTSQFSLDDHKNFTWDPWGRLVEVSSETLNWKCSYDAFGRRLQTTYTKDEAPVVTTSLYDPEAEFLEIGIKSAGNTFWKLYGNGVCEAIIDQNQNAVGLIYDSMQNLVGTISSEAIFSSELPTPYGPLEVIFAKPDPNPLFAYAQSLTWQGKAVDETGLIWFGARYYHPLSGRFLSPDPLGYPRCLDLYNYANGDPINFNDPDGRCAIAAFETVGSFVIDCFSSNTFQGGMQMGGSVAEIGAGCAFAMGSGFIGSPIGFAVMAHGCDQFILGASTFLGYERESATSYLLQKTGISRQYASWIDEGISLSGAIGAGARAAASGVAKASKAATSEMAPKKLRSFTERNFRTNLKRLTNFYPDPIIEAHHVFPKEFADRFARKGINVHNPKYGAWWEKGGHGGNAKAYNTEWREFLRDQDITISEIFEKGQKMMRGYGIETNY